MSNTIDAVKATLVKLLDSIQRADLETYKSLVSESLTCFEPETQGNRVGGVDFHLWLTGTQEIPRRHHLELVDPEIRVFGDAAYASYTLLLGKECDDGVSVTSMNETRIFAQEDGLWRMVHFHRSSPSTD